MKALLFTFSIFLLGFYSNAQTNDDCHEVTFLESKSQIIVKGNLKDGCTMPLKWAEKSSVACFPGTRFNEFKGNHILYNVELPAQSNMTITVSPKSKKRINLYAVRTGINSSDAPPNLSRAISCESAYPIYAGKTNYKKPTKPQSVEYMSINKSYNIVIGVAGAIDVTEGDFELKIEIIER